MSKKKEVCLRRGYSRLYPEKDYPICPCKHCQRLPEQAIPDDKIIRNDKGIRPWP